MNFEMFFSVLIGLWLILAAQAVRAYRRGWLFRRQLEERGFPNDYAVSEHGGYSMDWIVMAPGTAYLAGVYHMRFASIWCWVILVGILVGFYYAGKTYNLMSVVVSDGFSVGGRMTLVGWLHGLFALPVAWVLCMVYCGQTDPRVSERDLIATSVVLVIFFPIGLMKFGGGWRWTARDTTQTLFSIAIVWIATLARLLMM